MSTIIVHEGVKKDITFTFSVDTTGDTIELYACDKSAADGEGTLIGTTNGGAADTDITFLSCDIDDLTAGKIYLLEAWIDKDLDSRKCVFPEDDEYQVLRVIDRRMI